MKSALPFKVNQRERPAMYDDPLGYFITWTTYGTWLPGDSRGWVEYHHGHQLPDPILELENQMKMTEDACRLSAEQREIVGKQVEETCRHRGWHLHIVNCRSNHVHVVVTAPGVHPEKVRDDLKAWCTRRLKEHQSKTLSPDEDVRENWWTERASARWLNNDASLEAAILYVRDGQDDPGRSGESVRGCFEY